MLTISTQELDCSCMSITGIAVPPETVEVMKALRARKHRFVVLTIGANNTQIVVRRTGSRDAIYEDLFTSATDDDAGDADDVPWSVEPCYIAIDWEVVVEGRARDKLLLIQYVPDTAPPKSRMLYSGSREALLDACCDGFLTMQANDISDLERSEINRKLKISS